MRHDLDWTNITLGCPEAQGFEARRLPSQWTRREVLATCAKYGVIRSLVPLAAVFGMPTIALATRGLPPPTALLAAVPIVSAKRTPKDPWVNYPTRLLTSLTGGGDVPPDVNLDAYGGSGSRRGDVTGFFHTQRIDGRWWFVNPEGNVWINRGVAHVVMGRGTTSKDAAQRQFGSETGWGTATAAMLASYGFNGYGAWSNTRLLRAAKTPLTYAQIWDFMAAYGRRRGGTYQAPGHTGYPKDATFVFDPEFERFCDEHARQLAATKDDPWLLGHFSDNELPFRVKALDNYLALPETDPGFRAARDWLASRGIARNAITDQDRRAFLKHAADRYFRIVSAAIKRHDPNHLYLGSRFYGQDMREQVLFQAAAAHVDVISINLYGTWTPDPATMATWHGWSGRPFLVSEFYIKAEDSGLPNTTGAGWIVKTQGDRGAFYQNFVLALLEARACVGWHWFKYMDNDPSDLAADPSNRDSNKGIVSITYQPYQPLLDAMRELNDRSYAVIDYIDTGVWKK